MLLYYRQRTIITTETNFIRTLTPIAHIYRLYTSFIWQLFQEALYEPSNWIRLQLLSVNMEWGGVYGQRSMNYSWKTRSKKVFSFVFNVHDTCVMRGQQYFIQWTVSDDNNNYNYRSTPVMIVILVMLVMLVTLVTFVLLVILVILVMLVTFVMLVMLVILVTFVKLVILVIICDTR